MILGKDNIERLPLPVGTSDWATFSRDSYCVDKTLLIKELIDTKTRVALRGQADLSDVQALRELDAVRD